MEDGYRALYIDGHRWMTDDAYEVSLQEKKASLAFGKVLVAGLGLGVFQKAALLNPEVESVTTVEISAALVTWMGKQEPDLMMDPRHHTVTADFFGFVSDAKFDFIYGDIWDDDSQVEVWQRYKEKAETLLALDGTVEGWLKKELDEVQAIRARFPHVVEINKRIEKLRQERTERSTINKRRIRR